MKKSIILLILIAIMSLFSVSCEKSKAVQESIPAPEEETKSTIDLFGIVKCTKTESIIIDFPAIIEEIKVTEGQSVHNDDVLVILNINEYDKQIENKEIMLKTELLDLSKLQKDLEYKENKFNSNTDLELQKSIKDLELSKYNYNSYNTKLALKQSLYESNSISQQEYDDFLDLVQSKKYTMEQSKLTLEILRTNKEMEITTLKENIEKKQYYITQIENELDIMYEKKNKSFLQQNKVIANIDNGVVYNLSCDKSNIIRASQQILSIMDLNSRIIESKIPEEFIKDVKVGAKVNIIPVSDNSTIYNGTVVKLSDTAYLQNGETNVMAQISIEEDDFYLLPNFNVDIEIEVEAK